MQNARYVVLMQHYKSSAENCRVGNIYELHGKMVEIQTVLEGSLEVHVLQEVYYRLSVYRDIIFSDSLTHFSLRPFHMAAGIRAIAAGLICRESGSTCYNSKHFS